MLNKTWDVTFSRVSNFLTRTTLGLPSAIYPLTAPLDQLLLLPTVFVDPPPPFSVALDAYNKGQFAQSKVGTKIGPSWTTHWWYVALTIPAAWAGKEVHFRWNSNCEAALWSTDGRVLNSFTVGGKVRDAHCIAKSAVAGAKAAFFIECACLGMAGNGGSGSDYSPAPPDPNLYYTLSMAEISVLDPQAWALYHDVTMLHDLAQSLPRTSQTAATALYAADAAVNALVLSRFSETAPAALKITSDCFAALRTGGAGPTAHVVYACGNTHIDTAWLWRTADTVGKCKRSWAAQLRLYNDAGAAGAQRFAVSQAQQVAWIKDTYPALYEEIYAAVAAGTFVPVGATWVEMDCNMPSGESLVRQFLHGQRFFQSSFGKACDVFWLPDTFGYSSQLPQIMKSAGVHYFMTQKLSWNQFNKLPFNTFRWEGLDGSQVLAHFPPSDTYGGEANVAQAVKSEAGNRDLERCGVSLLLYGYGDGGGGPQQAMLERLARMTPGVSGLPVVKHGGPTEFFQEAEKSWDKLCTWNGELYFETHRGTYTSQARNKAWNRASETLLRGVELAATAASLLRGTAYPWDQLDRVWKLVLLNQFHDIIPGSSIQLVYKDSADQYADIIATATALLGTAKDSVQCRVLNSLSWDRSAVVEVDDDGSLPSGVLQLSALTAKPIVVAAAPGMGWSTSASGIAVDDKTVSQSATARLADSNKTGILENAYLTAKFNMADGTLTSLVLKATGRESVAAGKKGNRFCIFEDLPNSSDAWDVDIFHLEKELDCPTASYTVVITEAGPLRAALRVTVKLTAGCTITQNVYLTKLGKRVDFDTNVTWAESHKFLKVEFAHNVSAMNATYETQFGQIERPTHFNTSWDFAKFEVNGHRFADLSECGFGVAVLNDCKYGYSTRNNVMRLSLLRSPKAPDDTCDMCDHHFVYSVFPHVGGVQQADVLRQAADLNTPLIIGKGGVASAASLFAVQDLSSGGAVFIEAVKLDEDRKGHVVLRLAERFGSRGSVRVWSPAGISFSKVSVANILEQEQSTVTWDVANGTVLQYSPFQIITLRLVR
jgi:alpha-mannosidase